MEETVYLKAIKLKETIEKDTRFIELNKIEKEMNENKEVISLVYAKDVASSEYSDILNHFSKDSETAIKYQKKLYEAKKALEEHPLVREYLNKYQKVRMMYEEINEILFASLNPLLCPKDK